MKKYIPILGYLIPPLILKAGNKVYVLFWGVTLLKYLVNNG